MPAALGARVLLAAAPTTSRAGRPIGRRIGWLHRALFSAIAWMSSETTGAASPTTARRGRVVTKAGADLVFLNGGVYTVDSCLSTAEAVAVKDHRIVFVGDNSGASGLRCRQTEVVDLDGRMLLPGFLDSHAHVSSAARLIGGPKLWLHDSLDGYLEAVAAFVAAHPHDPVVRGLGWDPIALGGIGPRKEDLDRIDAARPVALLDIEGHSLWTNSKALELAGISADFADPEGGIVERLPGTVGQPRCPYGEPSGTLRFPAYERVMDLMPPDTVAELAAGIEWFQREIAHPLGITAVFDPFLQSSRLEAEAYRLLADEGTLDLWVRAATELRPEHDVAAWLNTARPFREGPTTSLFADAAVKFMVDGVLSGHTAFLKDDYADRSGFRGVPVWQPDAMNDAVVACDAAGLQIHVHAIGDAALAETLDALEVAEHVNGRRDRRAGVTHLECVDPADIPRLANLGVFAHVQPYWALAGRAHVSVEVPTLGVERAGSAYPIRSLIDAGVAVASSSDWYVTLQPNPLVGIQTGVTRWHERESIEPGPFQPEERCTVQQMIRSFTIDAARSMFLDAVTGSIQVGKSADLVMLDRDIIAGDPAAVTDARVLMTVFRGRIVFDSRQ